MAAMASLGTTGASEHSDRRIRTCGDPLGDHREYDLLVPQFGVLQAADKVLEQSLDKRCATLAPPTPSQPAGLLS